MYRTGREAPTLLDICSPITTSLLPICTAKTPTMGRTKLSPKTPDESRLVVAGRNLRRRPKRSSRACERCHRRKVRCDGAISGFPCTNCRLDQYPCTLQPTLRQTSRVKQLFKAPIRNAQRGTLPQAKYRSNIGTFATHDRKP